MKNNCRGKYRYHSEFAASRHASIATSKYEAEMVHYRCGGHWHIANKKKSLRGRHNKEKRQGE